MQRQLGLFSSIQGALSCPTALTDHSTTAEIEGTDDKIIVGAKYGYALWTRETGKLEYIKKVWDERDGPDKHKRYFVFVYTDQQRYAYLYQDAYE